MKRTHLDWLGIVLVIISAIGFSAKAIFIKLAYLAPDTRIDPTTLLTLRMAFALPGYALIAWWCSRGANKLTPRDWGAVIILGLLGYYAASILDFIGLQYVSVSLERLIMFLNPTIVVLLSVLFTGYRIVRRDVFSLALCYLGIVLVFLHDLQINSAGLVLGSLLVFASAVCYACYLVGGGHMIKRIGAVRFGAYASLVSTVAIFIHFLATNHTADLVQTPRVYWLSGMMAIFSTVIPVLLVAEGVRRIGPSHVAMVSSIGPVATIFLGYLFLAEPITLAQLAGAGLVMGGVLLIGAKKTAPPPEPEP